MNGARWTLLAVLTLWVAARVGRNVRGDLRPRRRRRALQAQAVAVPTLTRPARAGTGRAVALWVMRRVILAAHLWPWPTAGVAASASLVQWVWVLIQGWPWWVGLVLALPGLVLAGYAVDRATRVARSCPWAALWSRLSRDVVQDGRVAVRAVLPGSRPTGRTILEHDEETGLLRRVGLLVRGFGPHQTLTRIQAATDAIAAAYLVDLDCVSVEPGPDHSKALVWVTTKAWKDHQARVRSSRMEQVHHLGPQVMDPATGRCEVGVQADSPDPMIWTTYTQGIGAFHGIVSGKTRSGKTNFLETLATVMCRSGHVALAFMDLAGGVTFGDWAKSSLGVAGHIRDAEALFQALDDEYERRIDLMLELGWHGKWRFSADRPAIGAFIDEGPELRASKKASTLLGRAVRLWGKAGMFVVLATQSMTIDNFLGDDAGGVAKDQLMSGNLAGFASPRDMAGMPFKTSDIPQSLRGAFKIQGPAHDSPTLGRALLCSTTTERHPVPTGVELDYRPTPKPARRRPQHVVVPDVEPAQEEAGEPTTKATPDLTGLDPAEQIRAVLRERPRTAQEVIAATGLPKTRAYELLRDLPDTRKAGGHGGRWTLTEEST